MRSWSAPRAACLAYRPVSTQDTEADESESDDDDDDDDDDEPSDEGGASSDDDDSDPGVDGGDDEGGDFGTDAGGNGETDPRADGGTGSDDDMRDNEDSGAGDGADAASPTERPDSGADGPDGGDAPSASDAEVDDGDSDDPEQSTDDTDPPDLAPGGPLEDDGRGLSGPLVLQVTALQGPAVPGQRVLYAINVGNTSNVALESVSVLMRVPEGHEFSAAADAAPDSSNCGNGTCSAGEEATWSLGDIPAGSTRTIYVNPQVLSNVGAGDTISTFLRASALDLNPISVTKDVPVVAAASTELALSATADPVVPGQVIELQIDLGHIGNAHLRDGELHLELPEGLSLSANTPGAVSSQEVTWSLGEVLVGTTLHRSLSATVDSDAAPGDVLNPRVTLRHEGGLEVDSVAQLPISVVGSRPPLSLTVTPALSPALPGKTMSYQLTVANSSPRAIESVVVALRMPRELSHHSSSNSDRDSSNCGNGTCSADEEALWTFPSIPAETTQTIFVESSVVESLAGDGTLITAPYSLTAAGVHQSNLLETVPVSGAATAQLAMHTAVDPVVPGQTFTYDVYIGQVGARSLAGAELRVRLPATLDVQAISDGGTQLEGGEIAWDLGTVAVANTLHRSIDVTLPEATDPASVLSSLVVLTHDGGEELDAVAGHVASVATEPLALAVSVEAAPDPITLGSRILYTTTVTNTSERTLDTANLLLRVPEGLSHHSTTHADPDSSNCGNGTCTWGEEATWNITSLAPGAVQIITVNPEVAATLVGGSLVTLTQRLDATDLGGTLIVRNTVPTRH